MATQTTQEERYIHCTTTQCTDASPLEGHKGVICPIDQRYHQFRQKCIYNRTYEEMGLTPNPPSAKERARSIPDRFESSLHEPGVEGCIDPFLQPGMEADTSP